MRKTAKSSTRPTGADRLRQEARTGRFLPFEAIEKGVPASAVRKLVREGALSKNDLYKVIPERTFKRRLAERANLRLKEADAVARLLRVRQQAYWAFQEDVLAEEFLSLPNPELANRIPMELAHTDAGAREVEALLYRFVHGYYS